MLLQAHGIASTELESIGEGVRASGQGSRGYPGHPRWGRGWVLSFGASVQPRALLDICVTGWRGSKVSVLVAAHKV